MNTLKIYLFTAIILLLIQTYFTIQSFHQIRFEEIYESVKGAYFFDHQLVISGLHTNVGWYAILVTVYKIFGFTLHTGQFIRLVIAFFSLLSLALLFSKFFKDKLGLIPFITLGLSPTLLFFNTQNLHLGLDLQILPIWLLILTNIHNSLKLPKLLILTALLFSLLMFGALIYPASAFYIPAFGLYFIYKLKKASHVIASEASQSFLNQDSHRTSSLGMTNIKIYFIIATTAFLIPLIAIFLYVENRQVLIYDDLNNSGLFRGGGKISISENTFKQGFDGLFRDLFVKAGSYHFEVGKVDFSDFYPAIILLFAFYVVFKAFSQFKESRLIIGLVLLIIISNLFIVSITSDYGIPGMKRATSSLASIYAFLVIAWFYVLEKNIKLAVSQITAIIILSVITLHHALVIPENLAYLKRPSPFKMTDWFDPNTDPQKSLEEYLEQAKNGNLVLNCDNVYEPTQNCEYSFIYPAIAGSCRWNNLPCKNIKVYNNETDTAEEMTFEDLKE